MPVIVYRHAVSICSLMKPRPRGLYTYKRKRQPLTWKKTIIWNLLGIPYG